MTRVSGDEDNKADSNITADEDIKIIDDYEEKLQKTIGKCELVTGIPFDFDEESIEYQDDFTETDRKLLELYKKTYTAVCETYSDIQQEVISTEDLAASDYIFSNPNGNIDDALGDSISLKWISFCHEDGNRYKIKTEYSVQDRIGILNWFLDGLDDNARLTHWCVRL